MNLRSWQQECVRIALNHYRNKKHFLCLATPGSGKSTMAAELSKQLLNRGDIDFILCFAPSIEIASGLRRTFSKHLFHRFDGLIGAIGGAYTYQGIERLGDMFWATLKSHRVLVVFDEIHHCAGSAEGEGNSWGASILARIQHCATYTLALTGTPWRSDNNPIVLSEYSNPEGRIHCNYIYGLSDAVKDAVCRKPKIILVDNERLTLTTENDDKDFYGLAELLKHPKISYQHLLKNDKAICFCLSLAIKQLDKVRCTTPDAAGLIVATSVLHANRIAKLLHSKFNKPSLIVTYRNSDPKGAIDKFRHSNQEWIVSVGMISEGTDIPRLQVCCHLSRITTELYFRQVLGRVLRTTPESKNTAWLFTFAEPQLLKYSNRIADEIPNEAVVSLRFPEESTLSHIQGLTLNQELRSEPQSSKVDIHFDYFQQDETDLIPQQHEQTEFHRISPFALQCHGKFRKQLISIFQSDLTY